MTIEEERFLRSIERRLNAEGMRLTERRMDIVGLAIVQEAQDMAINELNTSRPPNRSSRSRLHYHNSFYYQVERADDGRGGVVVRVWNTAPYAAILEYGNPPHRIAPRKADRLAWPKNNISGPPFVVLPPRKAVKWRPGAKSGQGYRFVTRAFNRVIQRQKELVRGRGLRARR